MAERNRKQSDADQARHQQEIARLQSRLYDVPRPPHEERLRRRGGGPYLIAPDSAEPIPSSIWARIDLDDLDAAVDRANEQLRSELTEDELANPNPPLPIGNYLPKESRDLLRNIGGDLANKILGELEVGDEGTPSADQT